MTATGAPCVPLLRTIPSDLRDVRSRPPKVEPARAWEVPWLSIAKALPLGCCGGPTWH